MTPIRATMPPPRRRRRRGSRPSSAAGATRCPFASRSGRGGSGSSDAARSCSSRSGARRAPTSSSRPRAPTSTRAGGSARSLRAPPPATRCWPATGALSFTTASGDLVAGAVIGRADREVGLGRRRGPLGRGPVRPSARSRATSGSERRPCLAAVNTVSGDVELDAVVGGARVSCVSGDVHVATRPGLALWIDVQSVSGSVTLRPRRRGRAAEAARPGRASRADGVRRRPHHACGRRARLDD